MFRRYVGLYLVTLCLVVQFVECRISWRRRGSYGARYGARRHSSYRKGYDKDSDDDVTILKPAFPRQLLFHKHLKVIPHPWNIPKRPVVQRNYDGTSHLLLQNIVSVLRTFLPPRLPFINHNTVPIHTIPTRNHDRMAATRIPMERSQTLTQNVDRPNFVNSVGQIQFLRVPDITQSRDMRSSSNRVGTQVSIRELPNQIEVLPNVINTNGQRQFLRVPAGIGVERRLSNVNDQARINIRSSTTTTGAQSGTNMPQSTVPSGNLNRQITVSPRNTNRQNTVSPRNTNRQNVVSSRNTNRQNPVSSQNANRQNPVSSQNANRQNPVSSQNTNRQNLVSSQNTNRQNTVSPGNTNTQNIVLQGNTNSQTTGRLTVGNASSRNNANVARSNNQNSQTVVNTNTQNQPSIVNANSQNTAATQNQNSQTNSNSAITSNVLESSNTNSQIETLRVLRETGWYAEIFETPPLYRQILRASQNPRIALWIQRIAETNLMEEFIDYVDAFTILTSNELTNFQMEFIMRLGGNDMLQDYLIDPNILQMVLNYVRMENHIEMMAAIAEVDADEFLINDPPLFARFLNNAFTVGQTDVIQSFARKGYLLGLLRSPDTLMTILQYSRDTGNSQFMINLSETGGIQQVIDNPGLLPGILQQLR